MSKLYDECLDSFGWPTQCRYCGESLIATPANHSACYKTYLAKNTKKLSPTRAKMTFNRTTIEPFLYCFHCGSTWGEKESKNCPKCVKEK